MPKRRMTRPFPAQMPALLRPAPPPTRAARGMRLPVFVILTVLGLLAASAYVDHCAQNDSFCTTTQRADTVPPLPATQAAQDPAPAPQVAMPAPERPVIALAFDPLPLSFDDLASRTYVLPPGRTIEDMATFKSAIALDDLTLIAVVRHEGTRRALVRLPDGRILRVQQGDTLDGGTVAAIGEDALYLLKDNLTPRAILLGG